MFDSSNCTLPYRHMNASGLKMSNVTGQAICIKQFCTVDREISVSDIVAHDMLWLH